MIIMLTALAVASSLLLLTAVAMLIIELIGLIKMRN